MNITEITNNNLCIQCGICSAICPKNCIDFDENNFPKINNDLCINCGKCLKVCSVNQIKDYDDSVSIEKYILGAFKRILNVQSKDENILKFSTSGGFVTTTIKYLLDNNIYDSAFLLEGYNYDNFISTKRFIKGDDLSKTPKSRYLTVSHKNTAEYIKNNPDEKVIIVGTGCAISGIRNVIKLNNLNKDNYLFIGLFCDKTMTNNVIRYFKQHKVSKNKHLNEFHFRTKDAGGWPGNVRICYDDNSHIDLSNKARMEVKEYFMPERCLYCFDKLNFNADISCGDNYIDKMEKKDIKGTSTIVVRTDVGQRVFSLVENLFNIVPKASEELLKAQGIANKEQNIAFAKIKGIIKGDYDKKYKELYKESLRKISLANEENIYKTVRFDIKMTKHKNKLKKFLRKLFFIK